MARTTARQDPVRGVAVRSVTFHLVEFETKATDRALRVAYTGPRILPESGRSASEDRPIRVRLQRLAARDPKSLEQNGL